MTLRDYQSEAVTDLRSTLRDSRSACLQLPTGGGKTIIFTAITERAFSRAKRVWIVVPRNELLNQASEHLYQYGVAHGKIAAGTNESRAYRVHVVSKDTLKRRWQRIKHWPDLVIIDEAHLNLDFQIELAKWLPEHTRVIGVTATPERLDGRGLSTQAGGIFDTLVEGPNIRDLVERGYLTNVRYFCPPVPGLEHVHRKGTEFDADDLEALMKKRAIYGRAVDHYREVADGKPALVYCRSVKAAYETAERFRQAGYQFECIEGNMSYSERKAIIDGLSSGRLHGVTNCELATYGLDVPRVECIIMLRPTLSRSLYSQMVGRGLRPSPGKEHCVILDHVGNHHEHGHPLGDYEWRFHGIEKHNARDDKPEQPSLTWCPKCYLYYEGSVCPNCGTEHAPQQREGLEEVDGQLVEIEPVPLRERDPLERREYQERITSAVSAWHESPEINEGAVGDMLQIARELDRNPMWVYWTLTEGERAVNIPLLHEIARQQGYKSGWAWYKRREIERRLAS